MVYIGVFIVLGTAFLLSAIAGIMSITGMMALFPAHAIVVAIMMGGLELGKIVASGWLKIYWTDVAVPRLHKAYLVVSTVILMAITSLGIFGYLSAGHNEQLAPLANVTIQSDALQRQITQKEGEVKRLEARVSLLDRSVASFIDSGHSQSGLRASQTLKKERAGVQAQIDAGYAQINDLNNRLLPFKQQGSEVKAKLGPLQNVADFFGWTDSAAAVRFIIGMIMVVFDPLAIILMISGLITLNNIRRAKKEAVVQQPVVEEPDDRFAEQITALNGALADVEVPTFDDRAERFVSSSAEGVTVTLPEDVSTNLLEEPEATFDIVQNLHDRVEALDQEEKEEEQGQSEEEFLQEQLEKENETMDHRERLIQLLQSEPNFLKEVEEVIEELANERVEREAYKIKAGLEDKEHNRTYGRDH